MGCQLRGRQNGGRPIRTAYDADRGSFIAVKAQQRRAEKSEEYAELRCCTQQQGFGIGNQRTKVCHGADADEDQAGIQTGLDTHVQNIDQAAVGHNISVAVSVRPAFLQKLIPELLVIKGIGEATQGADIGQKAAGRNSYHQQRFVLLPDSEVKQYAGDDDHDKVLPSVPDQDGRKAGFLNKLAQGFKDTHSRSLPVSSVREAESRNQPLYPRPQEPGRSLHHGEP